jgi:hypothetical protein
MTDITPPPELLDKWDNLPISTQEIFVIAVQWGANQELEACCEWLDDYLLAPKSTQLRAARRPKPPSLKEQSLALIDLIQGNKKSWDLRDLDVVRHALEQLDA